MQLLSLVKVKLKMLRLHWGFAQLFLIQLWHYNPLLSSVSLRLPAKNSRSFTAGFELELHFLEQLSKLNKLDQPDFRPKPFFQVQLWGNSLFIWTSTGTGLCCKMCSQPSVRALYGPGGTKATANQRINGSSCLSHARKNYFHSLELGLSRLTHTCRLLCSNWVHVFSSHRRTVLLHKKAANAQPQHCQAVLGFRAFCTSSSIFSPSRHEIYSMYSHVFQPMPFSSLLLALTTSRKPAHPPSNKLEKIKPSGRLYTRLSSSIKTLGMDPVGCIWSPFLCGISLPCSASAAVLLVDKYAPPLPPSGSCKLQNEK